MVIREESIEHFLRLMQNGVRFAMAGFSDAEWYSILGQRVGERTALGQIMDPTHGKRLLNVLRRRQEDPSFVFAVPKVLWTLPGFAEGQIDWFLGRENIKIEAVERDMLTDDLAREARLFPLVNRIRRVKTVMIGPSPLKVMAGMLLLNGYVEVESPNLHMADGGIERAVEKAAKYRADFYIVSAGVSAAVIVDSLHDLLPRSWIMDCGSNWDAFAGIGGQREWRAELYRDPEKLAEWRQKNLYGKST